MSKLDLSNVKYDEDSYRVYFTYHDLIKLPEFPEGRLFEIYNGELIVVPSPSIKHQQIVRKLDHLLSEFIDSHQLGEVFFAPTDVILHPKDTVIPDWFFIKEQRVDIIKEKYIEGPPDLIIEVLSSNESNDLVDKKILYEKYQVSEYWIIDHQRKQILQYFLEDQKYPEALITDLTKSLDIHSKILDTTFNVKSLFEI